MEKIKCKNTMQKYNAKIQCKNTMQKCNAKNTMQKCNVVYYIILKLKLI